MIMGGFELCTDVSKDKLLEIGIAIQNNENPMQYKKQLAREIISIYYNQILAEEAQTNWEKTFSEGGLPDVIPEIKSVSGSALMLVLGLGNIASSNSEFRRLVEEGAIKIINEDLSEEKITDFQYILSKTIILKIGKKKFVKIIV